MNPAHPLDGIDLGDDAVPTLVDWDRDGDLDLIVPGRSDYFRCFLVGPSLLTSVVLNC